MFRFQKEQQIANIAGVKIGGQPGERATVLASTIFYPNHSIVEEGAQYVTEIGLADRAINNSINMGITEEEINVLKNSDVDNIGI